MFVQLLVNGLVTGSVYAIAAVGVSLVYGILRLVNFAYGDMMTFGAFAGYFANATLGLPMIASAAFAMAAGAALSIALDVVLWRPLRLRRAGFMALFLASIGVALVLRQAILLVWGPQPRAYDVDPFKVYVIGDVRLSLAQVATIVADDVDLERIDVVRAWLRPPDEEDRLAQNERDADRGEEEAHEPRTAQSERPPEHDVERDREDGSRDHGEHRRRDHRQAEGRVREVPGERAEGHHVAVGEVDESEDPVDEGDADGGDRVHRAGDEAVHEQLREHCQITWGSGTVRPSWKRRLSRMSSTVSRSPATPPATIRPTAGAIMKP